MRSTFAVYSRSVGSPLTSSDSTGTSISTSSSATAQHISALPWARICAVSADGWNAP